MEIRRGQQLIENGTKQAIIEFEFERYEIFVFQGNLSEFDIVIKYKKDGSRIRTPKHIHWVVDVLMKMQGNEEQTKRFLHMIHICWNHCTPLDNNDYDTLRELIIRGERVVKIEEYEDLNVYGEYDVEFLYVLMELLAVQEKTNRADAYMFGSIIEQLLEVDKKLQEVLLKNFNENTKAEQPITNSEYLRLFIDAKSIEGCSARTIKYYSSTIEHMLSKIQTPIRKITTEIMREYLVDYQKQRNCSKTTVDNIRRNISSFFRGSKKKIIF